MDEFVFFLDFRLNLGHGIPDLLTEKLDFAYGFFWTMHLSAIASACLNIDVDQGRDCVLFVSSRRTICKAIWADATGASTLTRTLRQGRFQQLLARAQDGNATEFSKQELLEFLDGADIQRQKRGFFTKA